MLSSPSRDQAGGVEGARQTFKLSSGPLWEKTKWSCVGFLEQLWKWAADASGICCCFLERAFVNKLMPLCDCQIVLVLSWVDKLLGRLFKDLESCVFGILCLYNLYLQSESYRMEEFCINLSVEDIINYRLSLVSKLIQSDCGTVFLHG